MRKSGKKKMLGVSKNGMRATVGIMFFEMLHQQWKKKYAL